MKYHGTCSCGNVKIAIDTEPFLSYYCHCSKCRRFASGGTRCSSSIFNSNNKNSNNNQLAQYHAGAALWRWNVHIEENNNNNIQNDNNLLTYEHTSANLGLFAMSRGRCTNCNDPMIEYCHRLIVPFVMIACDPFITLPKPKTNIFYNSGYQNNTMGLHTIHTDIGSLLYEIFIILFVAIPSLPRSILSRFTRRRGHDSKSK